jgi:cytidine deaminase
VNDELDWAQLASPAWKAREHAHIIGPTKVGAAVLSGSSAIYTGCNVEHRFRSHDIHAETNALGNMVAAEGDNWDLVAVLIVSARKQFTPCGACLDWIFELGSGSTLVGHLGAYAGVQVYRADELMPVYPC